MNSFGPRSGGKTMSSGVFWPDDPHISLLPPTKIQMHKCGKCGREFCCFMNYRRHARSHRLQWDKEDLRNERQNIAAFLSKLPDDAFKRILDVNYKIEDICGVTARRGLDRFVHMPSFGFYAHNYFKSASPLHDTVQKQQVSSAHELFNILDEATEKTFLSGNTSEPAIRYMLEGAAGKTSLDDKMHIASVAFLVEHNLVTAWMSAKSEQARLVQEALEKEEEDAQRRQKAISEKKRMKRLKQKEKRALVEETGAEEVRSTLKDEADSCPKDGEALTAENSPKTSEKLTTGREPQSDTVSEPLFEAREVTEDVQDSGGWHKQGKVRWPDMVEPTHNRRNWNRNSRQDVKGKTFPGPLVNGMKPEQDNFRSRPKPQRVTTGMPPGARPTPVKLPSNVVWARKVPVDSGREDARSATLPPPSPAAGLSAAEAPSSTVLSAAKVASPSTGLLAPHAATASDVEPFLSLVTDASAAPAPATATPAPASAPEAPPPAGDASTSQEDGMNVMIVGTLKVPWSASTQCFRNELLTASAFPKASTNTPTTIEKAEAGAVDQTGSSSSMDVQRTVLSEPWRSYKSELGDQSANPGVSSSANVSQREVAPSSSTGSCKTVNQKAETVAAGQNPKAASPGPDCSMNASSRKAVPRSCKNELVTSAAVEKAESVASSGAPGAVERAASAPAVLEHQITYEEFMCQRWDAAFADPNAVVLKLDHEEDTGPDLKTGSR